MLRERLVGLGDHVEVKAKRLPLRRLVVVNESQRRITVKLDRKGGRTLGSQRYQTDAQVAEAYRRIVAKMEAQGQPHRTWRPAGTRKEVAA